MKQSIAAEWMKLRHSRLGLVVAILPLLSLIVGSANYYLNQSVLNHGWYSLWTQVGLFYGEFFLPILIAICCSYGCRIEHLNGNWKMVLATSVSKASIFLAKWVLISVYILWAQVLFFGLYWLAGKCLAIPGAFPTETLAWIIRGWFVSLSIIALQLYLSLRIQSFAIPIGISLCGVLIGLGMYVKDLGLFFPFSLLTIGMSVLNQEKIPLNQQVLFYVMTLLYLTLFLWIAIRWLERKDIS